jgi:putative heme-binding domain-containing protein
MGNIHGNCINVDVLKRDGSTYASDPAPDFLSANDAWFMPVVQKTGPDGSLYILDWYDRYHCYQDARRDPAGIDRLKGRLYRIRYGDTPRAPRFDLAQETDDQLIERLHSGNVLFRDLATRLLVERSHSETRPKLERLTMDAAVARKARMAALRALVGTGSLPGDFHLALLEHEDPGYRAWGVRAAGNYGRVEQAVRDKVAALADDRAPEVRLQVATAARKIEGLAAIELLVQVLANSGDDKLIPHVVWQNLHPLLEENSAEYLRLTSMEGTATAPAVAAMMPRVIDRMLGSRHPSSVLALVKTLSLDDETDRQTLDKCFASLTARLGHREITPEQLRELRPALQPLVEATLSGPQSAPLFADAALLATSWRDPRAIAAVRKYFASRETSPERRAQALDALIAVGDDSLETGVGALFGEPSQNPIELRSAALASLSRVDAPWVAATVLGSYEKLEPELRPRAIELLTERRPWAEALLDAIGRGDIPASALNANQVRNLRARGDAALTKKVEQHWGVVRDERNPAREAVIAELRPLLRKRSGNPHAGQEVFKRVCGQCHKMYGEGQDVGPDITRNGRASFEQLLSNVFDPSLVIGAAYQASTVVTTEGRVLTGLVAENSPSRVVLKVQGGKQETIPRAEVEEMKTSALSLMPEDLEKQLKPEELVDLFAYITLDKPPDDPAARLLPGSHAIEARQTTDRAEFAELVQQVAPQFTIERAGPSGLAIVAEHAGREGVLRTSPVRRESPCVLLGRVELAREKPARLVLDVSHDPGGAWTLVVKADGKELHRSLVGGDEPPKWRTVALDLTPWAGRNVKLEVLHTAVDDRPDGAYWGQAVIVAE